ncbi:Alpha/Beta hydrolase protein [Coprinopsis sp. MPI-PUGE-AT-0042]|nr:Alpha/Beta hydrolase protein [Coprinopsis sp. MPI-PUGE-AT-0042]
MPLISASPPAGPITFCYTIATPTCNNSQSIDSSLPTVLLVVPYYGAQQMWHPQLCDPPFRRFNLVTFDSRGQGRTVGAIPEVWGEEVAAEDVHHLMEVLNISECHIMGLSNAGCIALRVAMLYPRQILSVTMVSPLPLEELQPILEGRQELLTCWEAAVRNSDEALRKEALKDVATGGLMLATNGDRSKIVMAMVDIALPLEFHRNGRVEALSDLQRMWIDFFAKRDSYPRDGLQRVECPILLIHCGEDVAYPRELADEVKERMEEAGLDVTLVTVDGAPHYGTFTHYEEITPLMHDFVLRHCNGSAPTIPEAIESPFEPEFVAVDCPNLGRELDDDVEFFS